jgi:hypothetical protein
MEARFLQSKAGHRTETAAQRTKRVYAHLLPKRARATASRIDAALGRRFEVVS